VRTNHASLVRQIVGKVFGEPLRSIERMTTGSANEVYAVGLAERDVIVRMNADPRVMQGSERHIALFKGLGIAVPEILAADYAKASAPLAYQVQTRLPGADIGRVIASLSPAQCVVVAKEIAAIARKLAPLPTDGRFGWTGGGDAIAYDAWFDLLTDMRRRIAERGSATGTIEVRHLDAFDRLLQANRGYFESVRSVFYFDDMSSKNVMVDNGRFSGLVDLDTVAHGDPLEGIGRIEASWYGTAHGRCYADAVMDALGLARSERRIVRVYGVLNRISWLSEHGIRFNGNTTADIDRDAVERDRALVDAMLADLEA
jgi:aminoglycoside phosphotransferase (APT) family kinase protein